MTQQNFPQYPQQYSYQTVSYEAPQPQRHSGVGMASFIVGLGVALMELIAIILCTVFVSQGYTDQSPQVAFGGCMVLLGLAAAVGGVIMGIIGMCQKDRKKLYSVLGLCINGVILLGVLGLILIGLAVKHR